MQLDLSKPEGYNIASAMRGPDSPEWDGFMSSVKNVLTGRIRWLCGVRARAVATRSYPATEEELSAIICVAEELDGTPYWLAHYLFHVQAAIEFLLKEPFLVERQELRRLMVFAGQLLDAAMGPKGITE